MNSVNLIPKSAILAIKTSPLSIGLGFLEPNSIMKSSGFMDLTSHFFHQKQISLLGYTLLMTHYQSHKNDSFFIQYPCGFADLQISITL